MKNAKDTYGIKNVNFFQGGKGIKLYPNEGGKGTKLYPNEGGITKNKEK